MTGIFDIINAAGISVTEAADLFEVTRSTVYNWESGVDPKSKAVYKRAMQKCELIKYALQAKLLPLPVGMDPNQRRTELRRVLIAVMGNLKKV